MALRHQTVLGEDARGPSAHRPRESAGCHLKHTLGLRRQRWPLGPGAGVFRAGSGRWLLPRPRLAGSRVFPGVLTGSSLRVWVWTSSC